MKKNNIKKNVQKGNSDTVWWECMYTVAGYVCFRQRKSIYQRDNYTPSCPDLPKFELSVHP